MPRVAIPRSKRVAELLRARRQELGLTLREVQKRSASFGTLIPFSTIARIESGKVDPGVLRFQQLLRIYDVSPEMAGEVLDLELTGEAPPRDLPPRKLYRLGMAAHEAGDLHTAAAHLLALRHRADDTRAGRADRQRATIALAETATQLGKYRFSKQLIEELLQGELDPDVRVWGILQLAVCWFRLGGPDLALILLAGAEAGLRPDQVRERAGIAHQRASILHATGDLEGAQVALASAVKGFRKAGDAHGEAGAESVRISILLAAGELPRALAAADRALQAARERRMTRLATARRLDRGRVLVAMERWAEAVEELDQAFREAVRGGDTTTQFHAQYHLWKAYQGLRDVARAEAALTAARYFVQFVDLHGEEPQEIRTLGGVPATPAPPARRRAARSGRRARA